MGLGRRDRGAGGGGGRVARVPKPRTFLDEHDRRKKRTTGEALLRVSWPLAD